MSIEEAIYGYRELVLVERQLISNDRKKVSGRREREEGREKAIFSLIRQVLPVAVPEGEIGPW